MDAKQANKMSIRQYLSDRGINSKKEHAGYGMYKSPLREGDNYPSFKVDYNANLWYDFGTGEGGTFIDLIMRLELCDFTTAMKLIENSSFSFQGNKFNRRLESDNLNSEIRIISIQNILNSASIQYLQNRGVNNKIACKYCKEIHYSVNKHSYFAIGFANDAGGWVLRNKYFKGNIAPSSIRTINNNATHCIVFEGFIDFLSYLSLYPEKELNTNYVVLNSTSQIKRAISFLGTQERVISMLDNDEAGRSTKNKLIAELNIPVIDNSTLYADFNDFNEYLQNQNKAKVEPEKPAPSKKKDRSNDFGMSM